MNTTNLNAIVRVSVAGVMAAMGIALVAIGAVNHDVQIGAIGGSLIAASGLTAWDTRIS